MKTCPNCNFENPDESGFCTQCGAPLNGQPAYQPVPEPKVNPYDHTGDYEDQDIHDNKLFAMACYLMSFPGILIALLANKKSPYVMYHIHQGLKFILLDTVLLLISAILAWTVLVPLAGALLVLILQIVRIFAFVDVCRNKVIEPWGLRKMKFLD